MLEAVRQVRFKKPPKKVCSGRLGLCAFFFSFVLNLMAVAFGSVTVTTTILILPN